MNFHKMPNRLKHKLSRVITSFQLCRSKDPSCPEAPTPAIHRLSPFNPKALDINYPCNLPAPPPPSTPYYKCQVSRKTISVGCKCHSRSCPRCCMSDWSIESPDFACKKEARWLAKPHLNVPFSFSDESGDMSPFMVKELLQCFLSLNSRQYHGVIVQAFSEVWEIVFCDSPWKVWSPKNVLVKRAFTFTLPAER